MPVDSPVPVRPVYTLDRAAAREQGRSRRRVVGRRDLATLTAVDRDPIRRLHDQNADRVPDLVPMRMQRMLESPFAFYRGTAALMAADLADDPNSGVLVASCGDAHVSNFGFYASPERQLVFDLNDFDEAAVAPWEWDVKRLLTSVVIGAKHVGYADDDIARMCLSAFAAYASTLRQLTRLSAADRFFMHLNADQSGSRLSKDGRRALRKAIESAEKRTGARALRRTTERGEDGRLRFVERPPTMMRFDIMAAAAAAGYDGDAPVAQIGELFARYRDTVGVDIDVVLSQYSATDLARRVVGVGSVGTRCYLQLLEGPDGDALVLQVKEAGHSVLAEHGGIALPPRTLAGVATGGEGFRVVGMQRILQAVSDPFLGWFQGNCRDYYVRQFNDMKGSIDLEGLTLPVFEEYAQACAIVLGRAHAQSPTAAQVAGYIGKPDAAGKALLDWSLAYAELSLADYAAAQTAFADMLPADS